MGANMEQTRTDASILLEISWKVSGMDIRSQLAKKRESTLVHLQISIVRWNSRNFILASLIYV